MIGVATALHLSSFPAYRKVINKAVLPLHSALAESAVCEYSMAGATLPQYGKDIPLSTLV
ncbi:hypothetical protein M408DRAFT_292467 [Serendipita vermifera MAFF 305830]|uniref:Uncharacterized protein n=1 Tax=Serendipita vermifera MAFF 305830 TaxID=933852 RepID=A0A0C3AQC7_SERVB|nr:hypothetical protein M408DRAFT_292467 [Serendipita vermifera MAFF 305830]